MQLSSAIVWSVLFTQRQETKPLKQCYLLHTCTCILMVYCCYLLPQQSEIPKNIVIISMKHFTSIVKFMAPGSAVQIQWWGKFDHIIVKIKSFLLPKIFEKTYGAV